MISYDLFDRIRLAVLLNHGPLDLTFRAVVTYEQFDTLRAKTRAFDLYGPGYSSPDTLTYGPWTIHAACAQVSYAEVLRDGRPYCTFALPADPTDY